VLHIIKQIMQATHHLCSARHVIKQWWEKKQQKMGKMALPWPARNRVLHYCTFRYFTIPTEV